MQHDAPLQFASADLLQVLACANLESAPLEACWRVLQECSEESSWLNLRRLARWSLANLALAISASFVARTFSTQSTKAFASTDSKKFPSSTKQAENNTQYPVAVLPIREDMKIFPSIPNKE